MNQVHNEIDQIRDIGGFTVDCYAEYGDYVNKFRHVPSIEDGLKPVYRRVILAALGCPQDRRVKTANLIGQTIGCFAGETELLDINNSRLKLQELAERNLSKEPVYTLSYSFEGVPKVARILKVWSRGNRSDLVKVTLDNGESFRCTSDHKILTWNGYVEASKLSPGSGLIPVVIDAVPTGNTKEGFRRKVFFNRKSKWIYRLAAKHKDCKDVSSKESLKTIIHHSDFNALNDYPSNLVILDESLHRSLHGKVALSKFNTEGGLSERNKKKWKLPDYRNYMKECVSKGNSRLYRERLVELLEKSSGPFTCDELYKTAKELNLKVGYKTLFKVFDLFSPEELEHYGISKDTFFVDSIDMTMCKGTTDVDHMWYRQTFRVLRDIAKEGIAQVTSEVYESHRLNSSYSFYASIDKYRTLYDYFGLTPCEYYWKVIKNSAKTARDSQILSFLFEAIRKCKETEGFKSLSKVYEESRSKKMPKWSYYETRYPELITEGFYDKLDILVALNHKVVSVEPLDITEEVFDVMVDSEEHNFALAAGCVAKNCYHPHGDASVNDVIAQLVRVGILEGKGNFGDKGMFRWTDFPPAAPRYTEVRMNPKFRALISKLLPYVPTHLNDLDNWEADYLPLPCALGLSMGSFGIGVGLSINIPAFELKSLIKAGYAAIADKPTPWKYLQPNYGLTMSESDKELFWKCSKGTLTYKFTVTPGSSGGMNGWYITGDPSFVKPKFDKLFKLKDDFGKVVIRDESVGTTKKVFVARSKRIKTITDSEVEAEVYKAAEVTKSFSLAVVYKGQTRPITGGEWIQMCMLNYNSLVKKFKSDSINKLEFEIEAYTNFREVADRILNTKQSYETIRKGLHLSEGIVEKIASMKISTLRDLDPKKKLDKLEQDKKYYESLTTKVMLAEYLK